MNQKGKGETGRLREEKKKTCQYHSIPPELDRRIEKKRVRKDKNST